MEHHQPYSQLMQGTAPQSVNQSVVLLGGGILKEVSNANSSRVDAYNQFKEFKERFI